MEMDIQKKTYLTTEDLVQYCYRVASTVGLMCIEIFGYKNKSTRDYAINLGVALQLTNIMRDVKKDADFGRIYLPKNDMEKFNYSETDLMSNIYNPNFIELMKYEGERAEYYFNKANSNLDLEDKPALFAARAMQHIYYKLLQKLHAEKYDVFNNKINVSKFDKTAIAVGVWAKYRLVY
jgi:phytoene synthase